MKLKIDNHTKLVNGTVMVGDVFWGVEDVTEWDDKYIIYLIEKNFYSLPKAAYITIYKKIKEDTFDRKFLNTTIGMNGVEWYTFVIGLTDVKIPQRLLKWISNVEVLG